MEAALGHEGQEAQGFQGHGLAAGVGPRDDQGVKGLPQFQVNGHRRLGVQQGMPGLPEMDGRVPPDLRPHAVHLVAELSPGENQVQVDQGVVVPLDVLPVGGGLGGELRQDALDLLLLLGLQLHVLVVGLDHPHGLHEDRGPGGGDVMDQAREVPLLLRLYRYHEAAIPLGDDGLLEHLGVAGGGDDLLENLAALGLGGPHVAADVRQLRGSGVGDGVLVRDAALDLVLQEVVAVEGEEQVVDGGFLRRVVIKVLLGPPGGGEQVRDPQQLPGVQAAPPVRPVQGLAHGLHAGKGRRPPLADHLPGGVGLVQEAEDLLRFRLRGNPEGPLLGLRADGPVRQ